MPTSRNIAQAEFSHVGGNANASLESVIAECQERIADGVEMALNGRSARSGIKTTVRFLDRSGGLTKLAKRSEALKRKRAALHYRFPKLTGIRRSCANIRSRHLEGKARRLRAEVHSVSIRELLSALMIGQTVAVEQPDRTFRLVRRDETYELMEAVARSQTAWLFVFAPNDLFADENVLIASAM